MGEGHGIETEVLCFLHSGRRNQGNKIHALLLFSGNLALLRTVVLTTLTVAQTKYWILRSYTKVLY